MTLFVRLFHEALNKPAAAGKALSKAVGAMENLADTRNPRHSLNMLRLHRAGSEVVEAQKLLFKEMDVEAPEGTPTSTIPAWVESRIEVVESALRAFYVTAGDDARTQRESIGFLKVSR